MSDDRLTHQDLSRLTGVSVTTIKSYRKKFAEFFPVVSHGKPLRFASKAADVCRRVRACFDANLSIQEIREQLSKEFPKQYEKRNVSITYHSDPPDTTRDLLPSLELTAGSLHALAQAQGQIIQRLASLQETMADFLSLHLSREDAFTAGLNTLKTAWREELAALRQSLEPAGRSEPVPVLVPAPSGRKVVTIRNILGEATDYLFETTELRSAVAETVARQLGNPPPERFLGLPLVVRSEQGEFLGVAGRAWGAFALRDFLDLLVRAYRAPRHFEQRWERRGLGWRLTLEQVEALRPERYALDLEQARTPRNNDVAMLSRLAMGGEDVPPPNLYGFIRQLREMTS